MSYFQFIIKDGDASIKCSIAAETQEIAAHAASTVTANSEPDGTVSVSLNHDKATLVSVEHIIEDKVVSDVGHAIPAPIVTSSPKMPPPAQQIVWSDSATISLINLCSDLKVDTLHATKGSGKWKTVAQKLQELGHDLSDIQAKVKWSHEKAQYRKFIDSRKTTGARRVDYKFAKEMAEALQDDLSVTPQVLGTASAGIRRDASEVVGPMRRKRKSGDSRSGDFDVDVQQDRLLDAMERHHNETLSALERIAVALEKLSDKSM